MTALSATQLRSPPGRERTASIWRRNVKDRCDVSVLVNDRLTYPFPTKEHKATSDDGGKDSWKMLTMIKLCLDSTTSSPERISRKMIKPSLDWQSIFTSCQCLCLSMQSVISFISSLCQQCFPRGYLFFILLFQSYSLNIWRLALFCCLFYFCIFWHSPVSSL